MPKEQVVTCDNVTSDRDEWPIAEVRWSRETGHVQVVTRVKGCEVWAPPDTASSLTVADCRYGMYVTLDRPGINDLIRYLRRARDQAFGRDE